jgi:hypothetical protein
VEAVPLLNVNGGKARGTGTMLISLSSSGVDGSATSRIDLRALYLSFFRSGEYKDILPCFAAY